MFGLVACVSWLTAGCQTTGDFEQPQTSAAPLQAKNNDSNAIILRAGDTIKVSFPGSPNLDTTAQIRRDGKISLPLVNEVDAAGLTPDQLQENLLALYSPQLSTKQLTVSVESSTFPVFVTGFVVHPGKVTSNHPLTALEAVMEAGGFDYTKANLKKVEVIRNESVNMKHFNLNLKEVMDGKDNKPFYLEPSDIIYVPERFSWY